MKELNSWKLKTLSDWELVIKEISDSLYSGVWVELKGDLGAGKTSFVRSLLQSWGYTGSVASPTYPLVIEYEFSDFKVVHLDAYRLKPGDHTDFDLEEWRDCLVFVEWAENIPTMKRAFQYVLEIEVENFDKQSFRKVRWWERENREA